MNNQVKLQGIAQKQTGTQVKDLQIGDVLVWNFGYKSEVVDLIPSKSGKTYTVKAKSCEDGIVRDRKMAASRLVVVDGKRKEVEDKTICQTVSHENQKEVKTESINPIQKAIDNRKVTHYSIYSDIGTVLDKFSTMELAEYYIQICNSDSSLRYYLEQEIVAHEIYKQRAV